MSNENSDSTTNDKEVWVSNEEREEHMKSFGNPSYDPETGLSKGKSAIPTHTIIIGKTSDGLKNPTEE